MSQEWQVLSEAPCVQSVVWLAQRSLIQQRKQQQPSILDHQEWIPFVRSRHDLVESPLKCYRWIDTSAWRDITTVAGIFSRNPNGHRNGTTMEPVRTV